MSVCVGGGGTRRAGICGTLQLAAHWVCTRSRGARPHSSPSQPLAATAYLSPALMSVRNVDWGTQARSGCPVRLRRKFSASGGPCMHGCVRGDVQLLCVHPPFPPKALRAWQQWLPMSWRW